MTKERRNFRLSKAIRPLRYELRFELDLARWTSRGTARIALWLDAPVREITLHALGLEITGGAVEGKPLLAGTAYEEASQTATLRFASEIPAGERVLELTWTGEILESLRGLYRSTRGDERYAATQFEAADTRRAFPCFDEPEFKARFALELVYPGGLAAIANAPIERSETLADERALTRFRETPKISPYLLAFTVGPYEATPLATTPSGVPVRVWLPPGLAVQGTYARDAHARALGWLEAYTAIPYPYRKIDAIGIPDFEAGAMENPGAITYRTRLLAADEKNASITTFKGIFSTAAHELTHMWWGDLVTMAWWTDLWLNESFASFVGEKATAALNPEWRFWRDFVAQNTSAFNLDSLASTHPISVEAKNAEQASERFDAITYTKGAAVLRMIEGYLGEEIFREGVRIYLRRHAEANATADDFWHALDEASGEDVTTIANAWIHEPGHPLVSLTAREEGAGLRLELSQQRYFADPDARSTDQRWPVPLVIRYGSGGGTKEKRLLLAAERGTVTLPGARWYYPNAGGKGFYRYVLDDLSLARLASALRSLGPEERLALLDDQWALTRHGKAPLAQFFALLGGLRGEKDRAVLAALSDALTWLSEYALTEGTAPAFERFIEDFYRPLATDLGWDVRDGEDSDARELRPRVLGMLGRVARAADVRAEALRRVRAHLDGGARLHPDIAGAVVGLAAATGDAALWDRYLARMKEAQATDAQEEARFRQSLVAFEVPSLARRTAEAIFSDDIRPMERGLMLMGLLQSRHTRDVAWPIVRDAWDAHIAPAEPLLKQRCANAVSQLATAELAPQAIAFLEVKKAPDFAEVVAQSIERLRINTAAAGRLSRELGDELAAVSRR